MVLLTMNLTFHYLTLLQPIVWHSFHIKQIQELVSWDWSFPFSSFFSSVIISFLIGLYTIAVEFFKGSGGLGPVTKSAVHKTNITGIDLC